MKKELLVIALLCSFSVAVQASEGFADLQEKDTPGYKDGVPFLGCGSDADDSDGGANSGSESDTVSISCGDENCGHKKVSVECELTSVNGVVYKVTLKESEEPKKSRVSAAQAAAVVATGVAVAGALYVANATTCSVQ